MQEINVIEWCLTCTAHFRGHGPHSNVSNKRGGLGSSAGRRGGAVRSHH